jgi:hypothetical protein
MMLEAETATEYRGNRCCEEPGDVARGDQRGGTTQVST